MIRAVFEQVNAEYGPPADMAESQVMRVAAYRGQVKGGSLDGVDIVVTAWKPTIEELAKLNRGGPLFLTFVGSLPPHYPSTSFEEATRPV